MALVPNFTRKSSFILKKCAKCGQSFGAENFAPTSSIFYSDGVIPICDDCVTEILGKDTDQDHWDKVNKVCQMCDIPFVPKEWTRLEEMSPDKMFHRYAEIFINSGYDAVHWDEYEEVYKALKAKHALEDEIPLLDEQQRANLRRKWGSNYDDEALDYLEQLFGGLLTTQNVNGALQVDQALKLCKMSYEIDRRIAAGEDFDKLLGSYDKMVKAAEFTPKNVKNINDFDSIGEVTHWMEKNGWRNQWYDDVQRDIVDESMKSYEGFAQRLYTNESAIPEEIQRRIDQLKSVEDSENAEDVYYGTNAEYDLDAFEREGYQQLLQDAAAEEFEVDLENDYE